jgi:hypothetical protein
LVSVKVTVAVPKFCPVSVTVYVTPSALSVALTIVGSLTVAVNAPVYPASDTVTVPDACVEALRLRLVGVTWTVLEMGEAAVSKDVDPANSWLELPERYPVSPTT